MMTIHGRPELDKIAAGCLRRTTTTTTHSKGHRAASEGEARLEEAASAQEAAAQEEEALEEATRALLGAEGSARSLPAHSETNLERSA